MGIFPRVVDADMDGRKDLLVGDAEGEIVLYMNVNTDADPLFDGGTSLQAGPAGLKEVIDVGQRPTPFVVDWDGDGRRDLLVGAKDGLLRLYINSGSDSGWDLDAPAVLQYGGADLVVPGLRPSPHVIDMDGDGKKDIIAGNTDGEILFYANTGSDSSPAFGPFEYLYADATKIDLDGLPRTRPFICDWDEDGVNDMIVGSADGLVRLYRGVEDRTTGTGPSTPSVATGFFHPPYPNPFNPAVIIPLEMREGAMARVEVVDVSGRRVAVIAERFFDRGHHRLEWDGRGQSGADAASGVYFLILTAGDVQSVRKIVLAR